MKCAVLVLVVTLSSLGYGQIGAAVAGYNEAQERDLERKHQLQMQREAEQTALEIARIQAQAQARASAQQQPAEAILFWQSGNEFIRGCADVEKQPSALTNYEAENVIACVYWLRGVLEGVSLGVQFDAVGNAFMHAPWSLPDNATPFQAAQVLVKYIRQHPEIAQKPTIDLTM